jgi:mannan endo-1,4-beta-mannosidase
VASIRRWTGLAAVTLLAGVAGWLVLTDRDDAVTPPGPAPTGGEARTAVLTYLAAASGKWTVSGQHNREPNDEPTRWTQKVHDITGKYPGVWGADLSFHTLADRRFVVAEAKRQWAAGSLVTLMWHMCPPTHPEPCGWNTPDGVWARLTDAEWSETTTPGTPLNRELTEQWDAVIPLLRELRDAGVGVLWRPLHEMNDTWPWWGGRPGPGGSPMLYRMMHDYFTAAGLGNLVWVWNVSDRDPAGLAAYDPGAGYTDVASMDIWQSDYPRDSDYRTILDLAGGRPIALGEVRRVPSPEVLAAQPRWAWFLVWAETLVEINDEAQVKSTYYDARVRNRDTLGR